VGKQDNNNKVKDHAPKMVTLKISNEFIGAVIGPRGGLRWKKLSCENHFNFK